MLGPGNDGCTEGRINAGGKEGRRTLLSQINTELPEATGRPTLKPTLSDWGPGCAR